MKLSLITISLLTSMLLVGCGGSSSGESEDPENSNYSENTLGTNGNTNSEDDIELANGEDEDLENQDYQNNNVNHFTNTDNTRSDNFSPQTDNSPVENSSVDKTAPVLNIIGESSIELTQGDTFTDLGATATDDKDGSISVTQSGTVDINTVGSYTITYTAIDQAGNQSTATRTVEVKAPVINDSIPPVITISGENPLSIFQGETFSDPGATATDNIDGEVAVTPSGSVDMSTVGEYTITYTTKDSANNEVTATRTVKVKSAEVIWNVSTVAEFRQALEDASANGENDKIVLSAGTYKTTSDGLGTFKFNDDEAFDLTVEAEEGLGRDDVVLSGDYSTQVFNFNNTEDSTLIFRGVSIVDGNGSLGSGISTVHHIKIENCDVINNSSSYYGGGVFSATAIITNSTISNNSSGKDGGGFWSSSATITNSTISNNSSGNDGGGFSASATITDSIISNNSSGNNGGGFHSSAYNTILTNSTISKNHANNFGGGFYSSYNTTITNSTISDNNSSGKYGGFFSNKATKVIDSTVSNNIANRDAGGFNSNGTTTVLNSTIKNNQGTNGGGFKSNGFTLINNSKISNNSASLGGGFYINNTLIVINSVLENNTATYGAGLYSTLNSYLNNNNFIGNSSSIHAKGVFVNNIFDNNDEDITLRGTSKLYNNYIDYNKIEEGNHNVIKKQNLQPSTAGDIYLNSDNETLANNSPVIDKGLNPSSTTYKKIIDNDEIYNQMVELLTTDKVGNRRVHNGTIDMGAVEYGSSR